MVESIQITGLREFQASLRKLDANMPKLLRVTFNGCTKLVIDYAGAHMPRKSGRAAASLKPRSSQREARIAMGGRRAPYAPWLDFGGQGRRKGRPPARPFLKDGRYVYKGLAVHRDDITALMAKGLSDVAREAGLDVT
jgi:hypothetical protein